MKNNEEKVNKIIIIELKIAYHWLIVYHWLGLIMWFRRTLDKAKRNLFKH